MSEEVDQLKQAFGKAIVARDHEALDVILAPWISVAAALEKLQFYLTDLADELDLPTDSWPTDFEASSGVVDYDGLRELSASGFAPGVDIPSQVTADNYEGWHLITGFPPEGSEIDAYFSAWFAVVRLADGLHVGSLEIVDPD